MKYEKIVVPVSVCAAVVVAAIAAIVVTGNRAAAARAKAAEAAANDSAKSKAEKIGRLNRETEAEKSRQMEESRKKAEAELEIKRAEATKAEADAAAAKDAVEKSRLDAETARNNAKAAQDMKAAEKAKRETEVAKREMRDAEIARELALTNAAVAEAQAKLATERRKTEAIIAEATALQLRKVDFEALQRDLMEFKQELDERERALHPDVTIYDSSNVTWVAEREADVIGVTNRPMRVKNVLPEDDPTLPKAARDLARADRLAHESHTNRLAASQAKLVGRLERLRDAAVREGRVNDANFYQKSINSLYPDYQK